jgi:hypothetical protein
MMLKKCIICGVVATHRIKNQADSYCLKCAEDNFGDLSYLQKVEEEAIRLKQVLREKLNESETTDD